ncbi:MAG: hypothetical protein KDD11_01975 [Acidobacteria bacterium]|nr:hypothetical protein [Acidobacteriota bacterium]
MAAALLLAPLLATGVACNQPPGEQVSGTAAAETREADPADFVQRLAKYSDFAAAEGRTVVAGNEGWLFFLPELQSLAAGPFWGPTDAQGQPRSQSDDPLPAILDFRDQLEAAGAQLLLVPVPAKASLYPDRLFDDVTVGVPGDLAPYGGAHQAFLDELAARGVHVLDLYPLFAARRFDGGGRLYCRTDTHWSGRACQLTAEAIVRRAVDEGWIGAEEPSPYRSETKPVEIRGDLWRDLPEPRPPVETLELALVGSGPDLAPVEVDRSSPVLVLGDSHALVFHAGGDLHSQQAGLSDQLALGFGFPIDLIGVRGSGADAARINLLRRGTGAAGKKLVVWVFSARTFTERGVWKTIPLLPPEG